MANTINPRGIGNPIAGIFTASGTLLAYSPILNNSGSGIPESESGYYVSSCIVEEDDEDGVRADITLHTNDVKLIDNQYFVKGATLRVATGYIEKEGPKFGPSWSLVLKDFKANYDDHITYTLLLVDALSLTKVDKGDDIARRALDQLGDQLDQIERGEELVEEGLTDLDYLMEQINKIRENIKWRNEKRGFQYYHRRPSGVNVRIGSTTYNLELAPDLGYWSRGELRFFEDPEVFREFIREKEPDSDYTERELIEKFSIPSTGSRGLWQRLIFSKSPVRDLFGFEMGGHGDRQAGIEGDAEWVEMLEELGIMDIVRRRKQDAGHIPIWKLVEGLHKDQEFMEGVLQEYLDMKALEFVERDVNLSVEANLRRIQNEQPGGPFQITDLGRSDGSQVRTRNFNGPVFMDLIYRGGEGDLLNISFETDFYPTSMPSSQAISVDNETGDITASQSHYMDTTGHIPRSPEEVAEFVDQALETSVNNNRNGTNESLGLSEFLDERIVTTEVTLGGSTMRPAGYSPDGNPALAIDRTAVYLDMTMRTFHSGGPGTIDQIRNEIENRKGEMDIRRIKANATIIGRPLIRSGMIFNVLNISSRLAGRYYCLGVKHVIDPNNGYVCQLELGKIIPPQPQGNTVTRDGNRLEGDNYKHFRNSRYNVRIPWISTPWAPLPRDEQEERERVDQGYEPPLEEDIWEQMLHNSSPMWDGRSTTLSPGPQDFDEYQFINNYPNISDRTISRDEAEEIIKRLKDNE